MSQSRQSNLVSQAALAWVSEVADLTQPDSIYWCDGSKGQYDEIIRAAEVAGTLIPLNPAKRPRSFLARTHPRDVARVEDRTYVCTPTKEQAGRNNNWRNPDSMRSELLGLFKGSMRGRVMYVLPFVMGPIGSSAARAGLQVTDSPYVAASMTIMTRVNPAAFEESVSRSGFVRALHSVGAPLAPGEVSASWPHNEKVFVAHFPQDLTVMSFGSGYGGNALLAKKCFALRLASFAAYNEGWLAEHMLIVKITDPAGGSHYIAGAFPSACGKTNLSMMQSPLPGWRVETIGDDIAWIHVGEDGRLWAINPEAGFFGVAPGTSPKTNPVAVDMLKSDTIFTNTALTADGDVWWEGLTDKPPPGVIDWRGDVWQPDADRPAAHPNARFTVATDRCRSIAPEWDDPQGVPISAILVGGRRSDTVPLITESLDWSHGVFLGASMSSARTAAAEGEVGLVRRDPFAMLPFCGYDMTKYWQHWLDIPKLAAKKSGQTPERIAELLPRIYQVNWFRTNQQGEFVWPGFSQNLRLLAWVIKRIAGVAASASSPLGKHPSLDDEVFAASEADHFEISEADLSSLFDVDINAWSREVESIANFFDNFCGQGSDKKTPKELHEQLQLLRLRLAKNPG